MASLVVNNSSQRSTDGWVAQWVGPVCREACITHVASALGWGRGPASAVVEYLKSNVRGLPELEEEFGSSAIRKALGDKRDQILVPYQVEQFMQTPLNELFNDDQTLENFGQATRVTEVATLFFKPLGLTLRILNSSSQRVSIRSVPWTLVQEEYGDVVHEENQWMAKLDRPIGIGRTTEEQNALIPQGAEIPYFDEHAYTLFTQREAGSSDPEPEWVRCKEEPEAAEPLSVLCKKTKKAGKKSEIITDCTDSFNGGIPVQWKFPAEQAKETT